MTIYDIRAHVEFLLFYTCYGSFHGLTPTLRKLKKKKLAKSDTAASKINWTMPSRKQNTNVLNYWLATCSNLRPCQHVTSTDSTSTALSLLVLSVWVMRHVLWVMTSSGKRTSWLKVWLPIHPNPGLPEDVLCWITNVQQFFLPTREHRVCC